MGRYNGLIRLNPPAPRLTADEVRRKILEQDRQDILTERRWKADFEYWWAQRQERANRNTVKRRMAYYQTNVSTLTLEDWKAIQTRYGGRCAYCHRKAPLTKDHIVPISKGGFHTKLNVIPACRSCNSKKGNRPAHFYKPILIPF